VLRAGGDMGFTEPTPIQTEAIPPILEGRDVLDRAIRRITSKALDARLS